MYYIGCGGYVNGAGIISSPNWSNEPLENDEPALEYPDECLWFIEARQTGETILLKKNVSLIHQKLTSIPIVVSLYIYICVRRSVSVSTYARVMYKTCRNIAGLRRLECLIWCGYLRQQYNGKEGDHILVQ